jgi:SAM-dependent methyltransferase
VTVDRGGDRTAADSWASGDGYEPYIGRWSRSIAREFLVWIGAGPGARWLDLGCGTGALTQTILANTDPAHIDAVDASAEYVSYARQRVRDSRVSFTIADGRKLPPLQEPVDFAVSGLVLNFIPQPHDAVAEMIRVARPGGTVAAYLWDYAGEMQLIRYFWDAAIAIDPAAEELDEGRRFPICKPARLEELFKDSGLGEVATRAIDVPTRFQDFNDYWQPFLGGQGPAPGYAMSLTEGRRAQLREHIRAQLPVESDGSINLVARAWAVRGTR